MQNALFAGAISVVLIITNTASANTPVTRITAVSDPAIARHHWVRIRYHVTGRYPPVFDRRKLGMLCVLLPDLQVSFNWPGPACAYDDNFIFLRYRHQR